MASPARIGKMITLDKCWLKVRGPKLGPSSPSGEPDR